MPIMDAKKHESADDAKNEFALFIKGRFHFVVNAISQFEFQGDTRAINVEFECLAGNPDDDGIVVPIGETFKTKLWLTKEGGFTPALERLAMLIGLIEPGTEKEIAYSEFVKAEGCQFIVGVVHEEGSGKNEGKTFDAIGERGCDIWAVDHAEVADVEKDEAMIAEAGEGGKNESKLPPPDDDFGDV